MSTTQRSKLMNAARGIVGLAVLCCAVVVTPPTYADNVIYDNGAPNEVSGNEATQWVQAEDFVLGAAAPITGAGVFIGDFSPEIDTWDNLGRPLQYFLFTDDGFGSPTPGLPLASGDAQGMVVTETAVPYGGAGSGWGNAFEVRFDLENPFPAQANTRYWFGIHLDTNYAEREDVYWITTDSNSTFTGHESDGGTLDNWFDNGSEHAGFYLSTVPEPSTVTFAALGLLSFGLRGRRRA